MVRKTDPYKKGTKPPKSDELTAEYIIKGIADHMGVSVEEAIKKIEEFSIELKKLKNNK
jgi:hypothetical protein